LAEWVATYDELLDKRQLQHNNITVVRYRRGSTNGRNMIVSSTSELRLLGVLVRRRLDELNLPLGADEIQAAVEMAKRDALSVSGDIVLRAAKRGVSAGEMLGLVLSRYLLAEEFKAAARGGQVLTAYFLLGLVASFVVLIGLACKNAILIVEFARELEREGKNAYEAAMTACRLRLRPILMTSFAFIMGVVPLVLANGAGAEMRQAIGIAVFFGMLGVTLFGLFLTPVFYVLLRSGAKPMSRSTPPGAAVYRASMFGVGTCLEPCRETSFHPRSSAKWKAPGTASP
jgi:hypothetical protein